MLCRKSNPEEDLLFCPPFSCCSICMQIYVTYTIFNTSYNIAHKHVDVDLFCQGSISEKVAKCIDFFFFRLLQHHIWKGGVILRRIAFIIRKNLLHSGKLEAAAAAMIGKSFFTSHLFWMLRAPSQKRRRDRWICPDLFFLSLNEEKLRTLC